jgi:hypothetical protein
MRWLTLLAFTVLLTAQEKPSPVPVIHLNHAFYVPDEATYEAIRANDFLRKEFGVNEERTTQRTDIRYTGIYFYGANTYFEFLKPDERNRTGASKVAFGVDSSSELAALTAALKANGILTETHAITRPDPSGKQVPWFEMMDRQSDIPSLGIWTLEYLQQFLRIWHAEAATHRFGGVRRADVLARYAAVLKQSPNERLLQDITAITLHFRAAGIEQSVKECLGLGMRVSGHGTRLTICEALDVRFELKTVSDDQPEGIAALHFALRRPKSGPKSLSIGTTRLVFGPGARATWHLLPARRPRNSP